LKSNLKIVFADKKIVRNTSNLGHTLRAFLGKMGSCYFTKNLPISNFLNVFNLKSKVARVYFIFEIAVVLGSISLYWPNGQQPKLVQILLKKG
jgi:hypothetical protein